MNNPVLLDTITFNLPADTAKWLEFGPENANNVLTTGKSALPFRIKLDSTEMGVKLINWGNMAQDPRDDYARLP